MFILHDWGSKEYVIEHPAPHFPDGTLNLRDLPKYIDRVDWHYENDAEFFTLWCIRNHYNCPNIELYLPYIPHARMDRVKSDGECFTLKAFCKAINAMDFCCVTVEDPHSNVAVALLDRVEVCWPIKKILTVLETIGDEDIKLFFPDEGAMKRYSDTLGRQYEFAFGMKRRDWETGKILGLTIENAEVIKGSNVLIVDDICSKGGTFYHSAKALKEAGAQSIFLYITHCEKTIFDGDLYNSGLVDKIFTTNSIFLPHIHALDTKRIILSVLETSANTYRK